MTTFTSDDREEAYKKINEDVVPIPFAGWVNTAPPHIVDSGASVKELSANDLAKWIEDENVVDIMFTPQEHYRGLVATMLRQQQAEISLLQEYVCQLESGLDSSLNLNKAQAERQAKTLTDEEITDVYVECMLPYGEFDEHEFARAILRKAQEK